MDIYFLPKKNKTVERHKFNMRTQQARETFNQYLTDIRKLAQNCEFGNMKNDQIICGIRDNKVRDRLLREQDLTITKAITVCKAAEETDTHMRELYRKGQEAEVNAVEKKDHSNQQGGERYKGQRRFSEGQILIALPTVIGADSTTKKGKCPAHDKICKLCKKYNHCKKM